MRSQRTLKLVRNASLLATILFINLNLASQNLPKVEIGQKAFNIVGLDEKGDTINLNNYKGTTVLLNFTATYCGPCWKTYPIMDKMQKEYGEKLKVISVHFDDKINQWNRMAKQLNIEFKSTSIWTIENKSRVFDIYQIGGFPYFFIIDKDGIIRKKWFGNKERMIVKNLKKQVES